MLAIVYFVGYVIPPECFGKVDYEESATSLARPHMATC